MGLRGGDGAPAYTKKDFETDQDVRWCPGCGDYAILATVQRLLPELGVPKEDIVFISGIGCSSRFPYYMNTRCLRSLKAIKCKQQILYGDQNRNKDNLTCRL